MLSKDQRLTRKEFTPVYKLGKRLNTSFFSIIYKKDDSPKFSVVVSKKVTKSAVRRHKIRRWVYEAIRSSIKKGQKISHSTIFIVHPAITKENFHTIFREVESDLASIN